MRLRIAARRSDLARLQAHLVADALKKIDSSLEIEFLFKASLGDLDLDSPLTTMGNKGVFTQDFLKDLLDGTADVVVHSWKDLPTAPSPGTEVVATLPRADSRDVLLLRRGCENLDKIRVLSSSPRRAHNLGPWLPKAWPRQNVSFEFINVRGNIPTRLGKLMKGDGEALIVAKAALDRLLTATREEFFETRDKIRLVLKDCRWMVLPLSENPCAPAQGALAVEIKSGRLELRQLLHQVNEPVAFALVEREREILARYGGGCHQKIGVSLQPHPHGAVLSLKGLTDQGEVLKRWELETVRKTFAKAQHVSELFPRRPEDARWFERQELGLDLRKNSLTAARALYVSRGNALPADFLAEDRYVWAAGVASWEGLAKKGIWVNGCSESLGEEYRPDVGALIGEDLDWVRLTHEAAASAGGVAVATYRLVPRSEPPNLSGCRHFYWSSGSSFLRAFELYPNEMKGGHHSCGPGKTVEVIKSRIARAPTVFLSWQEWRSAVLPAPRSYGK